MRIISSVAALILIFLMISCCPGKRKIVYNDFKTEDLKWVVYSIGDTLEFTNQQGNVRQYVVRKIYKDTIPEMDKFSFSCKSNYFMRWTIKIYPDTSRYLDYDSSINFNIENLHKDIYITANWYDCYGYNMSNEANRSVTIKGIVCDDVYVATADTLGRTPNIIKFFYSRKYGFIRFDEYNGNVWELVIRK